MAHPCVCIAPAGEAEHAAIGHNAVLNFVPEQHKHIMRQAMKVCVCLGEGGGEGGCRALGSPS